MKKLIEFQSKCPSIEKTKHVTIPRRSGPPIEYDYAPLEEIVKTIRPVMQEVGLGFYHAVKDGNLACVVFDDEGNSIQSEVRLSDNLDPKAMGAALTYFRRYTLCSLLGIVTEDDVDAPPAERAGEEKPDKRPQIKEAAYKKAIDRIASGESDLFDKIDKAFALSEEQRSELLSLHLDCNE